MCRTAVLTICLSIASGASAVRAQNRVYSGPGMVWADARNWTDSDVPDTPVETAVFQNNGAPGSLSLGSALQVSSVRFDPGAPSRTINIGAVATVNGSGIDNLSGNIQTIMVGGPSMSEGTLYMARSSDFTGGRTDVVLSSGLFQIAQSANATNANAIVNGGRIVVSTEIGSATLGALSGTGTVSSGPSNGELTPQRLTIGELNLSTTFSGTLTESSSILSLIKAGTGTFILTGANNYTGTTTISAGALQIGDGGTVGSLGSGGVDLTNGKLVFNRNDAITVANVISGTGRLVQSGAGALTLSGANTYAGGTTINAGTVLAGSNNAMGTQGVTFAGPGTLGTAKERSATVKGLTINAGIAATVGASAGRTLTLFGDLAIDPAAGTELHFGTPSQTGTVSANFTGYDTTSVRVFVDAGTLRQGDRFGNSLLYGNGRLSIASGATYDLSGYEGGGVNLSGGGTITNNGGASARFVARQTSNSTFGGVIRDGTAAISLVIFPAGTLTLTGTNTYSGTTGFLDGSTLQIGDGGAAGSLGSGAVDLTNGKLVFNRSDALTVSNVITGTGSIVQSGPGTLTLSGANAYAGGTTINAGTILAGSVKALGTGSITFGGDGALGTAVGVSFAVDGVSIYSAIAGTVGAAAGQTLTLTGRLDMGDRADTELHVGTASQTGTVLANLSFVNESRSSNGKVLIDAGTLRQNGSLENTLSRVNGGLSIAAGATYDLNGYQGGGVNLSGGGTITNTGGTAARFRALESSNSTFGGVIRDGIAATGLRVDGGGTLTLTGTNTYSGTTGFLGGSTLQIGDGGTGGSLGSGDVDLTNGKLVFNSSDAITAANVISGNGSLVLSGTGTLTLTGANIFSGSTTISAGALQIGNGGTTGSLGSGFVNLTKGTLEFNRSDAITVANVITGAGSLIQSGTNTLTLLGDNLYTGGTTINAGEILAGSNHATGAQGVTFAGRGTLGTADQRSAAVKGIIIKDGVSGTVGASAGQTLTLTGAMFVGARAELHFGATSQTGTVIADFGGITLSVPNLLSVFIDAGTLRQENNLARSLLDMQGGLSIASGATYDLNGYGGGGVNLSGSGTITNYGRAAAQFVAREISNSTFSGVIQDNAAATSLRVHGGGTLTLTGANTYSGGTTINAGTILAGSVNALGTGGVTFAGDGALGTAAGVSSSITGITINAGFSGTVGASAGQSLTLGGDLRMDPAADFELHFGMAGQSGTVITNLNSTNHLPNTGKAFVDAGTLRQDNNLGQALLAMNGGLSIASGATYDLNGYQGGGVNLSSGGTITNNGGTSAQFVARQISNSTFSGVIRDGIAATGLRVDGGGTLTLTGTNTYSGTTGFLGGSTLQIGDGRIGGSLGSGDVDLTNGKLVFNSSDAITAANVISGNGSLVLSGTGTTTLIGSNSAGKDFTGILKIDAGKLVLGGQFGDTANRSATLIVDGGSLAGSGTFQGNAVVGNATLAPGYSPGTLTIGGDLSLSAGSLLAYDLGTPGIVGSGVNDLLIVGGNLTLDGTLNITAQAGFGAGYYRLFSYAGSLIDNGIELGSVPTGYTGTVRTNIAKQVNLLLTNGTTQLVQYWDGADTEGSSSVAAGDGGPGKWGTGSTSWTSSASYSINGSWLGQVGVFAGTVGGAVKITDAQSFQELRFRTDGYSLDVGTAGALQTTGGLSVIDAAVGVTATINASIRGVAGLTKTGAGTLILSGVNTFSGDTNIDTGALHLDATGSLAGEVQNNASFVNDGSVGRLVRNRGTLISTGSLLNGLQNDGTAILSGQLNGMLANSGAVTLSGTTTGIGEVTQSSAGSFDLSGFDTTIGSLSGDGNVMLGSATLTVGDATRTSFNGAILGAGGLIKTGEGTLTLGAANGYEGLTTIAAGTLSLSVDASLAGAVSNAATFVSAGTVAGLLTNQASANATNSGVLEGGVSNDGAFFSTGIINGTVSNSRTVSLAGQLNGDLFNSGSLTLTGTTTGIAAVRQAAGGNIDLNGYVTTIGSLAGTGGVKLGSARLTVGADNNSTTFSGTIAGAGGLTKTGTGRLSLTGASIYTAETLIDAGTLVISAAGSLAGAVKNQASFVNAGTVIGPLINTGASSNSGTLNGGVTNSGVFTSTGIVDVGLSNNGTAILSGQLNGMLANSGAVTLSGTTTGIGEVTQSSAGSFDLSGFDTTIGSLSGDGNVMLGSATLTVGDATRTSFNGAILGAGGLIKTGEGTLTLGAANGYEGLTTIAAGTLSLSVDASLAGAVSNAATFVSAGTVAGLLTNQASANATNSGVLEGGVSNDGAFFSTGIINGTVSNSRTVSLAGQLNGDLFNSGSLTLTGTTTGIAAVRQAAGGNIDLNGYVTTIGSLAGTGGVKLGSARLTVGADNNSTTFSGTIAGAGGLTKTGTGRLSLTGASIYTAETLIDAGTLVISAAGSLAGAVKNQASFVNAGTVIGPLINTGASSNSGTLNGGVTNSGVFTSTGIVDVGLSNNGTAILSGQLNGMLANSGAVTLSGTTTGIGEVTQSSAGSFDLSGFDTTIGSLSGDGNVMLGSATLTVGDATRTSFNGAILGAGGLTKTGEGTLILTGTNVFLGLTTINVGAVQLGNGGTNGAIGEGDVVVSGGILAVDRSDSVTLSNSIRGAGMFVQAGKGTTTLSGANSYTGGTLVSAGRLVGTSSSLGGDIVNKAVLSFAQTSDGAFDGRIEGMGALEKTGGGRLILSGDNSGLTGATDVLGGELSVTGLLSRSRITIGNGARLSGTGTVGGFFAQSGAIVAPGTGSIGTLIVNGNVTFHAASVYAAQVGLMGADLIVSNGSAQLAGTLTVNNVSPGARYQFNTRFTVLQANGGTSGTFDATTGLDGFGRAYRPVVSYTGTQVIVTLAPNSLATIMGGNPLTPNQKNVVGSIDRAAEAGHDPTAIYALYALDSAAMPAAANQLTGEIYAATVRTALEDERLLREATFERILLRQRSDRPGIGAWGQALRSTGRVDADGNAGGVRRDQTGFVLGVDGASGQDGLQLTGGLLGFYERSTASISILGSRSEINRVGGGAYAGLSTGVLRVRMGGGYAALKLDARRAIAFTGFTDSTRGKIDGSAVQAFGETALRIGAAEAGNWGEPFIGVSYTRVNLDEQSESGGATALSLTNQAADLGFVTGGIRGEAQVALSKESDLRLGGSLAARRTLRSGALGSTVALSATPAQTFTVATAPINAWAAIVQVNAAIDVTYRLSIGLGYSGVLSGNARDHSGNLTFNLRF
jgi:fibronectin-binding autotransporter adhesin